MKKTRWIVSVVLITLLSFILLPAVVNADPGWSYRRAVTITNSSGGTLTNYQVLVTLTTGTMGNPYTNINSDGSDLRLTNADNTVAYSYWIESWSNTGTSKIWVEVFSVPTGDSTMYMWYGNPSASSESNGDATFLFFDHFDGTSLNSKWTHSASNGSYSISNSELRLYTTTKAAAVNSMVRASLTASESVSIESKMKAANMYRGALSLERPDASNFINVLNETAIHWESSGKEFRTYDTRTSSDAASLNTYYYSKNIVYSTSAISDAYWYDSAGTIKQSRTGAPTAGIANLAKIRLYVWQDSTGDYDLSNYYWDWIFVRKYVSTEPTNSVGSQQSTGGVDPVPELPTIILLGSGLTALAAYFVLRRFRQVKGLD